MDVKEGIFFVDADSLGNLGTVGGCRSSPTPQPRMMRPMMSWGSW